MGKTTAKDMNDIQIRKKLDEYFDKIEVAESDKKLHCQWLGNAERFCLATTNASCKNCKMFSPTVQSKMRMLVGEIMDLNNKISTLKREVTIKEKKIERMESKIELLELKNAMAKARKDGAS